MKIVSLPRIALESPEAADFVRRSEPFVTNVRWPAHERWSLDYLRGRCGPRQVVVFEKRDDGPAVKLEVPIADYLSIVADPEWGKRYELLGVPQTRVWMDGAPDPGLGALLDDLAVPSIVDRARLQSINLWIQGGTFENPNHYDPNGMANLNVQVAGKKRWRLFDPNVAGIIEVLPALADIAAPLLSWQTKHPDACRDHRGYADAVCHEAVLEPGDAIFVPPYYMHWVEHQSALNINVNFWWAPERVPMASIPVAWAMINGLVSVFRKRMPNATLTEVCAAIAALPPETRDLLLDLERTLLSEPDLLTPSRTMSLRKGTGMATAEGVETKLRDRA